MKIELREGYSLDIFQCGLCWWRMAICVNRFFFLSSVMVQ